MHSANDGDKDWDGFYVNMYSKLQNCCVATVLKHVLHVTLEGVGMVLSVG